MLRGRRTATSPSLHTSPFVYLVLASLSILCSSKTVSGFGRKRETYAARDRMGFVSTSLIYVI